MANNRLVIALLALLAYSPELLASAKDDLSETQKALEASRQRQKELDSKNESLEAELGALQQKLIRTAREVQRAEDDVAASEEKLRILDEQLESRNVVLAEHRKRLTGLIHAALRLSRLPPEAALMMPDSISKSMKASRALKMMSENIRTEMSSIALQMKELHELEAKLILRRDELVARQQALDVERSQMERQVAQRRDLQESLNAERRKEAQKAAQLAKKAESLQGLIDKLRQSERADKEQQARTEARSFAASRGAIRLPASGKTTQRFGEALSSGSTSKGVVILARTGAQIVAPFDGEVVYAGTFLNYGKLVIIRHSDDYHSLLAGLAVIDTYVGEFLLEGEPIGAMGKGATNRLYIELRKNNQPIDPQPWIRNL